jgi:hypothetical protein
MLNKNKPDTKGQILYDSACMKTESRLEVAEPKEGEIGELLLSG